MAKPPPFGFGVRLQKARESKGLTGTALGKGMKAGDDERGQGDLSRQAVSDWEAERTYPTVWQLHQICVRLKTSADELLGTEHAALGLSPIEYELLMAFRNMKSPEGRGAVLRAANVQSSTEGAEPRDSSESDDTQSGGLEDSQIRSGIENGAAAKRRNVLR